MAKGTTERAPNPKGHGERLRGEIVAAARRLLEQSGSEDSVTLRATAREAGITAPAIYAHFADREEMVEAVIAAAFEEFARKVLGGMEGIRDPARRLRAACRAYVDFGRLQPATYAVIFTRHRPGAMPGVAAVASRVFGILVDLLDECSAAGVREGGGARADAAGLWLGMHGLASLPPSHPRFAWPDEELMFDRLLEGLVGLEPGSGSADGG